MIKQIEVSGLPRQNKPLVATFNSDINIITGRNGSGKTTLIKLLWYIISGNIEHALSEVPFQKVDVETSDYRISITRTGSLDCKIEFTQDDNTVLFEDYQDEDGQILQSAESAGNEVVKDIGSSIFFPTFRRIEGGFSIGRRVPSLPFRASGRAASDIEEALAALSRKMSVSKHTFVSAISTGDIVSLLMRNYTELSELSNNSQKEVSQQIIDQIKSYEGDSNIKKSKKPQTSASLVLSVIKSMVENMEMARADIMAPLDAVRIVVESLFQHSGIRLGNRLSFGDAASAVNSELLSAGEKQMLSFVCYNAFYKDSVIFIDEPELSLHVDWQRQLFPVLLGQGTSNQFVIATHSPFIYSKYSDKEIKMSDDRGNMEVDID